jgi:hypothetical protein
VTGARVTTKSPRETVMENIRLKISIRLNRNHALTFRDLEALKPLIERGIAACLPDSSRIQFTNSGEPVAGSSTLQHCNTGVL